MWLLAVFIFVPLIEIALFIKVGGWLTLWPTLAIVIATAFLGAGLVRRQGRGVLDDLRRSLDDLRDPSEPLVHGAMILLAGALLITPGFMTDAIGLALLIPAFRHLIFTRLAKNITIVSAGGARAGRGGPHPAGRGGHGDVIEGIYHAEDEGAGPSVGRNGAAGPNGGARGGPSGWTRH